MSDAKKISSLRQGANWAAQTGKFLAIGAWLILACFFALVTQECRAQTNIQEFPINFVVPAEPEGIVSGPDGGYWFTMYRSGYIGHLTTLSNKMSHVSLTNHHGSGPYSIVVGPDTNLWFTESSVGKIARLDPVSSNFVVYPLPNLMSLPGTIISGPDSNLWFIEFNLNRIAVISPAPATNSDGSLTLLHEYGPFGTDTRFGSAGTNAQMYGLTVGPDGNVWFTQGTYGTIGNINPSGTITNLYQIPGSNCEPYSIVTGSDGALWFTEYNTNKIGRITTSGQITEFYLPLRANYPNPRPYGIVAGLDGNIWFSEYNGSAIGRVTPDGIVSIFPTPTGASAPTHLATGNPSLTEDPDTNIWFAEYASAGSTVLADRIGKIRLDQILNLALRTNSIVGASFNGLLATFQNSTAVNTVYVDWGDSTSNAVKITSRVPNSSVTTNNAIKGSLTITNVIGINTNTGDSGTYEVLASHTYVSATNYVITLRVIDSSNDIAQATIFVNSMPFFTGSTPVSQNVDQLTFPDETSFGYYSSEYFPYVHHFDLGFEYFFDANDGQHGAYLYDFASGDFFYTSPSLFPYIYDFALASWLYYYPDSAKAGHYTTSPRRFYNFGTRTIITR